MAEQLDAELLLDISQSLSNVDELRAAIDDGLTSAAATFIDAMSSAIAGITAPVITPDVSNVAPDIDTAIQSANVEAPITPDVSNVAPDIDAAVAGVVPPDLLVQADPSSIPPEIDAAVAGVVPDPVPIEADTSGAVDAVNQLDTAATTAASNVGGLADATSVLGGAASVGQGDVGGLKDVVGGLGLTGHGAAAGLTAVVGGIVGLAQEGISATGAQQRLNTVLDETGASIDRVHVGTLNISLDQLGQKLGSTKAAMQDSAATILQQGQAAGFAADKNSDFAQMATALAARAVALKPSIGDVADVTARIETAFARAGRALLPYNISLSQSQVNQEAMNETGKTSAGQLTLQEKAYAGLTLATQKYGGSLASDIAKGSQNAIIQQRSLTTEIKNAVEEAGKPLVFPLLSIIHDGLPIVTSFGSILSELGQSVLPAVQSAAQVIGPVFSVIGSALQFLQPILPAVVDGFIAFEVASFIPTLAEGISAGLGLIASSSLIAGTGVLAAADEVVVAGELIGTASGPIGLIAAGLGLAAAAFGIFGSGSQAADQHLTSFGDSLTKTGNLLDADTQKALGAAVAHDGLQSAFSASGVTLAQFTNALAGPTKGLGDLADLANRSGGVTGQFDGKIRQNIGTLGEHNAALGGVLSALLRHGQLTGDNANALTDLASSTHSATQASKEQAAIGADNNTITGQSATAYQQATDAAKGYKTSLDALVSSNLSIYGAQQTFSTGLATLKQDLAASTSNTDFFATSGSKLSGSLHSATDDAIKLAEAQSQVDTTGKTSTATMTSFTAGIIQNAEAAGLSAPQIGQLVTQLGLTQFAAQGAQNPMIQAAVAAGLISPAMLTAAGGTGAANAALAGTPAPAAAASGAMTAAGQAGLAAAPGFSTLAGSVRANVQQILASSGQLGASRGHIEELARTAAAQDPNFSRLSASAKNAMVQTVAAFLTGAQQAGSTAATGAQAITQQFDAPLAPGFKNAADKAVQALINAINNNNAGSAAHSLGVGIGQSIDAGLASGVASNASTMNQAVTDAVHAAVQAGIAAAKGSPQYFTYYLGRDLMTQLAQGIGEEANAPVGAISSAIANLQSATAAVPVPRPVSALAPGAIPAAAPSVAGAPPAPAAPPAGSSPVIGNLTIQGGGTAEENARAMSREVNYQSSLQGG